MFQFVKIIVPFIILLATVALATDFELSQEFIDQINAQQSQWKAGVNFDPKLYNLRQVKSLMGVREDPSTITSSIPVKKYNKKFENEEIIPAEFDARTKWPQCPSISTIPDQGSCGSCWAVAAANVISDRICIHTSVMVNISAEDLMECCSDCGHGCKGGSAEKAWKYYVKQGIVSGGLYNTSDGCKPYLIPECDHHTLGSRRPPCSSTPVPTPECSRKCSNIDHKNYTEDLFYGYNYYRIEFLEKSIQSEIMYYGPIEVSFNVFEDFLHYKSGVYYHVAGNLTGRHAVRMIGWGVESGVPYWLVANSWNTDWGDNGLFKIRRGHGECTIESNAIAGILRNGQ